MNFIDIQPVHGSQALFIKKDKILIIADLHIGIEKQLVEYGVNTFLQINLMKDRIIKLCEKYKPKKIFLLGDVKHNIPFSTFKETYDVKDFLVTLLEFSEIHITIGNHDGNIKKISPNDVIIHSSSGFIHKNIGLIHGHSWPSQELMQCNHLIFGHSHPTILLEDRLGFKNFQQCWLKGIIKAEVLADRFPNSKKINFILMPAFNELCGGVAVNVEGILGPLGKIIDVDKSDVFLIDGSSLGKVINLKN